MIVDLVHAKGDTFLNAYLVKSLLAALVFFQTGYASTEEQPVPVISASDTTATLPAASGDNEDAQVPTNTETQWNTVGSSDVDMDATITEDEVDTAAMPD